MDARLRLLRKIAVTNNTASDWARYATALERANGGIETEPVDVRVLWLWSNDWDEACIIGLATTDAEFRQIVLDYFGDDARELVDDDDDLNDPQIHDILIKLHNENAYYDVFIRVDTVPL